MEATRWRGGSAPSAVTIPLSDLSSSNMSNLDEYDSEFRGHIQVAEEKITAAEQSGGSSVQGDGLPHQGDAA